MDSQTKGSGRLDLWQPKLGMELMLPARSSNFLLAVLALQPGWIGIPVALAPCQNRRKAIVPVWQPRFQKFVISSFLWQPHFPAISP